MTKRIWKWELDIADVQIIAVPVGAKFLSAQLQCGDLCLWALCDPDATREPRTIAIYGTGNPVPKDPGEYIGTVQTNGGALIWHVFERAP